MIYNKLTFKNAFLRLRSKLGEKLFSLSRKLGYRGNINVPTLQPLREENELERHISRKEISKEYRNQSSSYFDDDIDKMDSFMMASFCHSIGMELEKYVKVEELDGKKIYSLEFFTNKIKEGE